MKARAELRYFLRSDSCLSVDSVLFMCRTITSAIFYFGEFLLCFSLFSYCILPYFYFYFVRVVSFPLSAVLTIGIIHCTVCLFRNIYYWKSRILFQIPEEVTKKVTVVKDLVELLKKKGDKWKRLALELLEINGGDREGSENDIREKISKYLKDENSEALEENFAQYREWMDRKEVRRGFRKKKKYENSMRLVNKFIIIQCIVVKCFVNSKNIFKYVLADKIVDLLKHFCKIDRLRFFLLDIFGWYNNSFRLNGRQQKCLWN